MNDPLDATQPTKKTAVPADVDRLEEEIIDLTRPSTPEDKPARRKLPVSVGGLLRALGILLLGLLILLIMAFVGGWFGLNSAMDLRFQAERTLVAGQAAEQYNLAMSDLEAGRYSIALTRMVFVAEKDRGAVPPAEVARLYQQGVDEMLAEHYDRAQAHFELVLILDPNFQDVKSKLADVQMLRNRTATPTIQFTPTVTPTPDLRGEEELFNQIKIAIDARDWDGAIQAVTNLRDRNNTFRAVEVDGMYFTALRNRGVDRILVRGEPEGGIYDLTLAERIGPLDRDADSYRTWARYYITGAGFWEADWERAVYYFEIIYPALPNLRDASNLTAVERFRISALRYADQLMVAEDFCKADEYYRKSLTVNSDPAVQPTQQLAFDKCKQQEEKKEEPTPQPPTPTPEVTGTAPVETPSPTP